jgi:phosphohistidine phosphatase
MTDRTLIVLRHAKSDWSGDDADFDRPLGKRGRRQAPEAGRWLADNIGSIDLAVVSPANRARTTWDLAAAELRHFPPTWMDDDVYAASLSQLLRIVRALPDDVHCAVLVGHNPEVAELVSRLTGEQVPMPTSALAVIALAGAWSSAGRSTATLRASGRPPAGDRLS